MRWIVFLLPCLLAAQTLHRGQVDLRVVYESQITSEDQWRTDWGAFSKDYLNTGILDITLRQIGGPSAPITVTWYFIGHNLTKKKLFIYDSGDFTGNIVRGGVKLLPYSRELIANREYWRGRNRLSGAEPWGWAVFITQGGRALEEKGSTPEMIKWVREHRAGEDAPNPSKRENLRFIPQALGAK